MRNRVADIVLNTFTDNPGDDHRAALASISLRTWIKAYFWLDTSGLALYFIDRLTSLQMDDALPAPVRERLHKNLADNRERTRDTFAELVRINDAFTEAGIDFLHLKGISLVPNACSDPTLRQQLDLDLLTSVAHADLCRTTLVALGYDLAGVSPHVWEFDSGPQVVPSIDDIYKAKPQRAVELHFKDQFPSTQLQTWNGYTFPTLSDVDKFASQAAHLLKHVQGEWIRPSWLLEFHHSVNYWRNDLAFLQLLRTKAEDSAKLATAIGVAIVLTSIAFGDFAPQSLTSWTVDTLEPPMRLWLDRYGREVILASFPGTKLYLLQPIPSTEAARRRLLIPLRIPPPVIRLTPDSGPALRLRSLCTSLSFTAFRLRFHLKAGYRYLREAPRWKRCLAQAQQQ